MANLLGERNVEEPMHEKTLTPGDMAGKGLVAPDRIKQIANEPGRMTNPAAVSFFTAYAHRLFRKNFYFLSLKIIAKDGDAIFTQ